MILTDFLAKHKARVIAPPPYSPDLAPYDLFLFLKLKEMDWEGRYEPIEASKRHSLRQ